MQCTALPPAHADMQRFRWPGYEMQLLGELQRQQNSSQFCDTLLQTEGISVPTHSCVLAALSPYLSRELSASPCPPSGQKRQLQLQAVRAQTLLKLVGLLYSGEVEVEGHSERTEMLAAARWLGIARLVEGRGDFRTRSEDFLCRRGSSAKAREGLRSAKTQDAQVQAELTEKGDDSPLVMSKTCVSAGTQTGENTAGSSMVGQIEHAFPVPVALAAEFVDVSVVPKPQNLTVGQPFSLSACQPVFLDGVTTCGQSPHAVMNPTPDPVPSHRSVTLPVPTDDGLNSSGEDSVLRGSLVSGDRIPVSVGEVAGPEDGGAGGSEKDAGEDEVSGDKAGSSAARKPERVAAGVKSVAKMRQMMETAHISIKVKLRRRMKGELWEVVNTQSGEDSLSLPMSLKQGGSSSVSVVSKQDRRAHASPQKDQGDVRPPPPAVPLHSLGKPESWSLQTMSSSSQRSEPINSDSDSRPPSSCCFDATELGLDPQGATEETDEQIERLLEDIMMGLNILPDFDRGCKKSLQTDTGLQFGFEGQNPPGCTGPSDARMPQARLRESQTSPDPKEPAASSVSTTDFFPGGQKPEDATFKQEDQRILELLPLSNEDELKAEGSFLLDELRLPRCLSPLATRLPPARPPLLSATSADTESQTDNSLSRRPWLTEKPGSLQFPFPSMTEGEIEAAPSPPETNQSSWAECQQEVMQASPQSCTENDAKDREVKTEKKHSKFQQNDKEVDSAAPKKKTTAHKRCFLADKRLKLNRLTKNVCSVNLSSNNVLASGTEVATCSSIGSHTDVKEQNKTSSVDKSLTENHDRPADLRSVRPRIRTRGFVRKSQESAGDAGKETEPEVPPAAAGTRQDPSPVKRSRGRPRKWNQESSCSDSFPSVAVGKNSDVDNNEEKTDRAPKEEQSCVTARVCKKRKMIISEVEEVPLKMSAECTDEVAPDDARDRSTLKKPQLVSLTELKKLVKQRKSKEGRESEGPASDGGCEGDGVMRERTSKVEMDVKEKFNLGEDQVDTQKAGFWPGSESAAPNCSSSEDTSVFDEDPLESFSEVCEEGPATPSSGGEELLVYAEEAITLGTSESGAIGSSSRADCLTQENQTASGHPSPLQTAEETTPHLSGADGLIRTLGSLPGGEEEKEEEEEEVDVDVLLCSPENNSRITVCDSGLDNMDIEAAAEEDDEEIDVTGDEAE